RPRAPRRTRTAVWLVLHAVSGLAVMTATGLAGLVAVALPTLWLNGGGEFTFGTADVAIDTGPTGAWTLAAGLAAVVVGLVTLAAAGSGWRWTATRLLGPDAAERLAAAEAQARDLAHRN